MTDIEAENLPLVNSETVHTFRQTFRPPTQIGIPRLMEALWTVLRRGKFTGVVTWHVNQGGLRDVVTEQKLPE